MKHAHFSVSRTSDIREGSSECLCNSDVQERVRPTTNWSLLSVKEGTQSELVGMACGALGVSVAAGSGVSFCYLYGTRQSVNCWPQLLFVSGSWRRTAAGAPRRGSRSLI